MVAQSNNSNNKNKRLIDKFDPLDVVIIIIIVLGMLALMVGAIVKNLTLMDSAKQILMNGISAYIGKLAGSRAANHP